MGSVIEILPVGLLMIVLAAKVYYLVFAVLTIIGGVMGYVKAKSKASIIAGSVTGTMLIAASVLLPGKPIVAGVIALIASVMLAGKFIPDFIHKKAFIPGGLMAVLSAASIVLTILALRPK
jgi:uncharacterized membrane protein (UPF0136 family)